MELKESDVVEQELKKLGKQHLHFPTISMTLKAQRLDSYLERITGYSFAATMVVMLAFFGMLNQIKLISEN